MSTKNTLKYANTKDFMFHLYFDNIKGNALDIRFKNFNTTLLIDEKQTNDIIQQLKED